MNFLCINDITDRFKISKATVWAWTKEGKFPKPIKLGAGVTRWVEKDISDWVESKANK